MKKIIYIAFFVFYVPVSQSQVVTSSFDPTIFNFNPSANSTRVFDGLFTNLGTKKVETNGRETGNNTKLGLSNQNADWEVEDKTNSFRLLYADNETKFSLIPEMIVTVENLETTWKRTDNTGLDPLATFTQDNSVLNFQSNTAYNLSDRFMIGLNLGFSKIDQEEDQSNTIGGNAYTEKREMNGKMFGGGLGFTWKLPKNFFVGGSYNVIKLTQDTVQSGQQTGTFSQDYSFSGYNFGVAWQYGDVKSQALKIELSQRSNSQEVTALKNGVKRALSVEGMNEKFYLSGSIAQVKGESINFQNIVEAFLGERVSSNDSKLEYSVGGGFRTTSGHSFGGSAIYSTEEMPAQVSKLTRTKFLSEAKTIGVSVSYAYIY